MGYSALLLNNVGYYNTAMGYYALNSTTSGFSNTALGYQALYGNSSGYANTAVGDNSQYGSSVGNYNTSLGANSLRANWNGSWNVAIGYNALNFSTVGSSNIVVGNFAMFLNTSGGNNTAVGNNSMYNNTSGNYNTSLGNNAGPSSGNLSNSTAIGNGATTTSSNTVRIGNSSVTSIGGSVGWSTTSDGRFKNNIKENVPGLDFITKLKPVTYNWNLNKLDTYMGLTDKGGAKDAVLSSSRSSREKKIYTGFIAQQVEEVAKQCGFDFSGVIIPENENTPYSLSYSEFVVPLVKAVQELSAKVTEQDKTIEALLEKLQDKHPAEGALSKDRATLLQNHPNPFSSESEIKMFIPETAQQATITIYNLEGTQLKAMSVHQRGDASVKIARHELKPGMYIYALIVDNKIVDTKRMILTN